MSIIEALSIIGTFTLSNLRREAMNTFKIQMFIQEIHENAIEMVVQKPEVKEVLQKPEGYYDLVIIEGLNPILFGLQHKLKSPLIAITSLSLKTYWHFLYGNSIHPILYTDYYSELVSKLSFWEKFESIYVTVGSFIINKFVMFPHADEIARKYFGSDMPYIEEMVKSASVIFSNCNPIFSDGRPLAPNVMLFQNMPMGKKFLEKVRFEYYHLIFSVF